MENWEIEFEKKYGNHDETHQMVITELKSFIASKIAEGKDENYKLANNAGFVEASRLAFEKWIPQARLELITSIQNHLHASKLPVSNCECCKHDIEPHHKGYNQALSEINTYLESLKE